MQNMIPLKQLRQNVEKYATRVQKGYSFIITKRSKPLFKISPVDEGSWEVVSDFTKIRKGGVDIDDMLSRL
ncbi:MAG: type II toxin-antitoxin system prevent-host-death family antitoxin [Patescibacteria group bacterium]